MPLYEYHCERCGETFEVRQKFSDAPVAVHEGCGGEVKKAITAASFHFKGTGWYVTDYGRNGKKPSNGGSNGKSGSNTESKGEAKGETKSEAKAEAKAETKTGAGSEAKSASKDAK